MDIAALVTCHCGAPADAERAMRPLKDFALPLLDGIGPMPYSQLNSMLDPNYPKGALNYWKSNFLTELSDAAIDTMIDCFARCPTPMGQLLLEHFHTASGGLSLDANEALVLDNTRLAAQVAVALAGRESV